MEYNRMYEWRAKARMNFANAQDDQSLRILRMFDGNFSFVWSIYSP